MSEETVPPPDLAIAPDGAEKGKKETPFSVGLFYAGAVWALIALGGIVLYAQFDIARIAVAVLAAFAACAVGAVVGFLFGVPKARGDGDEVRVAADGTYKPNTNLEQVSDWLTKIIIGVGLVEIRQIFDGISRVGSVVGGALGDSTGDPQSGAVFAVCLLVGSAAITFLLVYMWTCTRVYDVFVNRRP